MRTQRNRPARLCRRVRSLDPRLHNRDEDWQFGHAEESPCGAKGRSLVALAADAGQRSATERLHLFGSSESVRRGEARPTPRVSILRSGRAPRAQRVELDSSIHYRRAPPIVASLQDAAVATAVSDARLVDRAESQAKGEPRAGASSVFERFRLDSFLERLRTRRETILRKAKVRQMSSFGTTGERALPGASKGEGAQRGGGAARSAHGGHFRGTGRKQEMSRAK